MLGTAVLGIPLAQVKRMPTAELIELYNEYVAYCSGEESGSPQEGEVVF